MLSAHSLQSLLNSLFPLTHRLSVFLILMLGLFVLPAFSADFQKGQDAADRGDYEEALKEWDPLAEQGDPFAQNGLGDLFYNGYGIVPQDYKVAAKWYRLSADQGYGPALYNLGVLYTKGRGVPQDYKAAVMWFKFAANRGNGFAMNMLGALYLSGQGVPQDYNIAEKWYRLAAEMGLPYAQVSLGFLYNEGHGVPQDYVLAHMWLNIAASNGNEIGLENRDIIARKMTPAQIEKAQDLAREWVSKHGG